MKKMRLFFLVFIWSIVPFSSVFANESKEKVTVDIVHVDELKDSGIKPKLKNGKWDYVGYSAILRTSSNTGFKNITDSKPSTGGDFMFCISNSGFDQNQSIGYRLYESDPDRLSSVGGVVYLKEGYCAIYRGIGSYVDGSNKKAEFAVGRENRNSSTYNHVYVNVSFYD